MANVNVQLLAIEAALTRKRYHVYHAALLDPHTAAELSIDDVVALCDE
jgi:alpha-galactosidase